MKTNYSPETSLPAYIENKEGKNLQKQIIYNAITSGASCLKSLEQITGLPQSTVAGRCNDLIKENLILYCGITYFENRKRKKIQIINGQLELFK